MQAGNLPNQSSLRSSRHLDDSHSLHEPQSSQTLRKSSAIQQGTQCMLWGRVEDNTLDRQLVCAGDPVLAGRSLKFVTQVACGGKHSIAVTGNGEVYTWGWNWYGQLGHGDMKDQDHATAVRSLALARALTHSSVVSVAAGKEHTLALTNTGNIYSWGGGREGQLGTGDHETSQPLPRLILPIHSVRITQLCAGGDHSVAVAEGGIVYSWGRGANGRLGHGDTSNRAVPTIVKALVGLRVTIIACGWSHSLAACPKATEGNALYAWGKGDSGQLGLGDRMDRFEPTEIYLESEMRTVEDAASRTIIPFQPGKIISIAAGYFHTGLVVKNTDPSSQSSSRVYTWGWGEHGQLGHGGVEDEVVPRVISALHGVSVIQMACGGAHTMLIDSSNQCYGFGNTEFGQLGFTKDDPPTGVDDRELMTSTSDEVRTINGSNQICAIPTPVSIGGYNVLRVACGWWHTVAIVQNIVANEILSPAPVPVLPSDLESDSFIDDDTSERDDIDEDTDFEPPSPAPTTGFFSKLRQLFGGKSQSDRQIAVQNAIEEWTTILTSWGSCKAAKRTRVLWRRGIPPNMRKDVWIRALNVSRDLPSNWEQVMETIHSNRASQLASGMSSETARLISLDVPRTYPSLGMFQKDCSLHQPLQDVLEAIAWSNPELGYCQGMSYLASTLLMYMDASMSYDVMTVLIRHPLLSALFAMNVPTVVQHMKVFEILFAKNLPRVYENFRYLGLTSDQYAMEWIMTLFSRALPLEISHRMWDCFIMEGEIFLYRAAVGILKMNQQVLEKGSFEQCIDIVKNFKEEDETMLFRKIFSVRIPKYLIAIIYQPNCSVPL